MQGQGNGKSKQTNEKNVPDVVSDSGAESCSEETKRKTAEAFMTGIMSSIPRVGTDNDNNNQDGESEDIVSEVKAQDLNQRWKLELSIVEWRHQGFVKGEELCFHCDQVRNTLSMMFGWLYFYQKLKLQFRSLYKTLGGTD